MVDVMGIQNFIFASNRLKDIVGASRLVELATSDEPGGWLNGTTGEVLVAAGGNAFLKFALEDEARQFASRYTRKLLEEAPGLEVAICHQPIDATFGKALDSLIEQLAHTKAGRIPGAPLLGLSIEATCQETGLPAVALDPDSGDPISSTIKKRRDPNLLEDVKNRWHTFLNCAPEDANWQFPEEIDLLGRTAYDKSTVGVVHIDLNRMGDRIKRWIEKRPEEELEEGYKRLSRAISSHVSAAFQASVDLMLDNIEQASVAGEHLTFRLAWDKPDISWLPLRPVILGGDDLTFICDGRIALELSAKLLEALQAEPMPILGEKVYGSAGVTIVNSHFPFARAYQIAEAACRQAKVLAYELFEEGRPDGVLNWHIMLGDLDFGAEHPWTARPYPLHNIVIDDLYERVGWEWLSTKLLGDKGLRADSWQFARNKLKGLSALAQMQPDDNSQSAIKSQLARWNAVRSNKLSLPAPIGEVGWFWNNEQQWKSPLADALELLDLHTGLE
jgi:hypothetical protein